VSPVLATAARAAEAIEAARCSTAPVDLSWLPPPAATDDWSLADDALRFLARLVATAGATRVLELGSGVSTRVLARACAGRGAGARVLALENDPVFADRTRRALAGDGLADLAQVLLTPVVVRRWHGHHVPVYHLTKATLDHFGRPDVVLVDGPPMPLGGREGALLQAVHLARPGTIVVLDDADREGERSALARVQRVFGAAVTVVRLDGFAKGLAAVVVRAAVGGPSVPPRPAFGERGG
jgi:predicted O-methyltransferase YrrM